jgi:hypothetical protein
MGIRDTAAVTADLKFVMDAAPGGRPEDVLHVLLGDVYAETDELDKARREYEQVTGASSFAAEQSRARLDDLKKGAVAPASIALVRTGTGSRCALKPVAQSRLQTVVQRLEQISRIPDEVPKELSRTNTVARLRPQPLHHVLALQRDSYLLVPLTDVCFFRVEDGVTKVKTSTALYRTNYAIGDLESRLPSPPFFRAHRSIIANLDRVATISPMFKGSLLLTMKDTQGSEIQVSERQAKLVRELLQL